ncbi:MAG: hypothetical protein WAL22_18620 [Solirubrobacteraceae bacterium]
MLHASAPWGRLMRELTEGGEPVGELGAEHAAWIAHRHGSRATSPADDDSTPAIGPRG